MFHTDLYMDSPTDIPHLEMDEIGTLTKGKNPAFKFCESEYYLAYKDGKLVGYSGGIDIKDFLLQHESLFMTVI